LNSCVGSALLC